MGELILQRELMTHLRGESLAIYKAEQDMRIRDFKTNEEIDQIAVFVSQWRINMGYYVGNDPDAANELKAEIITAVNHIRRLYGELTLAELQYATDLLFLQRLPVDVSRYRNLAPVMISAVLNAFRNLKLNANKEIIATRNRLESDRQRWSPEDLEKSRAENLKRVWGAVMSGQDFDDWGNVVYRYVKLQTDFEVPKETLQIFKKNATEQSEKIIGSRKDYYRLVEMKTGKSGQEQDKKWEYDRVLRKLIIVHYIQLHPQKEFEPCPQKS